MREVGVGWEREGGREGRGREGKLGGHIKTARGHRCWIIWKVWSSCAPPALTSCTWRRIGNPAAEPERRPSLRPPVSSCPLRGVVKRINEPKRHPTSPLRLILAFFGFAPGLPLHLPLHIHFIRGYLYLY